MTKPQMSKNLGFGLGLRSEHYEEILGGHHSVEWFEALTENYLGLPTIGPGMPLRNLLKIRERYPLVLHGVSLSIGGSDPISKEYLRDVQGLIEKVEPVWVSDHLCWTGVHGHNAHDLLPMPYTAETITHIVSRIQTVQEFWKRELVIENVSSYVEFPENEMTEWEFLREVVLQSGCKLLLDVNNIFVSSQNHRFDPKAYFNAIPFDRVMQIHLAGHTVRDNILIDTHDQPVREEVLALYKIAIAKNRHAATMFEWDANIPPLKIVEAELNKARAIYAALS